MRREIRSEMGVGGGSGGPVCVIIPQPLHHWKCSTTWGGWGTLVKQVGHVLGCSSCIPSREIGESESVTVDKCLGCY